MLKFMCYTKSAQRELLFEVSGTSRNFGDVTIQELESPIETDSAGCVALLAQGFQYASSFRIALKLLVKRFQDSNGTRLLVLFKHIPQVLVNSRIEHRMKSAWLDYRDRLNNHAQAKAEGRASETLDALSAACWSARVELAKHLGVNP